ncbi:MAG: alpha/beta hydrolase family protein, partial [Candidatus Scatosoma sp.]
MILSPVTIWKKFDLTQELNAETEEESLSPAGFCVQSVVFRGRVTEDGERVKIYARFTRPCGEEKAPALLLLPDALETGEELADYFALRGYATLIPDYCGKRAQGAAKEKSAAENGTGEKENAENAPEKERENAPQKARYTQYPACVAYADYEKAGALDRLEGENVEKSAWFEWAYVALYALEYLKSRSDVAKIGVAGVRLGGEIAWMTMLSPDISCGVAINAAGWRSHLGTSKFGGVPVVAQGEEAEAVRSFIAGVEAESYAPFVRCPVLMCCAMEDTFFDCDRAYDTFVRLGNLEGS